MGEKKARRDTGSKVGAAIVQCGEEEKEDDGRAEGEGTVLCRELRGSQEAKRTAALLCAGFRVWVCRRAHGALHTAAAPAAPEQLLRHAILACLRFAGSGRAGTGGRHLPSPFPCLCACLPAVSPKRNGRILGLHLIKMQGRRQTASSLLIREAGLRGSGA